MTGTNTKKSKSSEFLFSPYTLSGEEEADSRVPGGFHIK
jgi:hypothetical protein